MRSKAISYNLAETEDIVADNIRRQICLSKSAR